MVTTSSEVASSHFAKRSIYGFFVAFLKEMEHVFQNDARSGPGRLRRAGGAACRKRAPSRAAADGGPGPGPRGRDQPGGLEDQGRHRDGRGAGTAAVRPRMGRLG